MKVKATIILGFVIFLSSCLRIAGIKKPVSLDDNLIIEHGRQMGLEESTLFKLDIDYKLFLDSLKAEDSAKYHKLSQPIQVFYFNKSGKLISHHINCYAPGFPNLNWNFKNDFNTFPPNQQYDEIVNISFDSISRYFHPLHSSFQLQEIDFPVVVVFWNKFMTKSSRSLIEEVKKNMQLGSLQSKIYFVNNDSFAASIW